MTQPLNEGRFDQFLAAGAEPVLIDFWAPWCGPCRMLAPVLDDLSVEFEGRARVAKVNVDDNPDLARRYGVRSLPTLVLFRDGRPVATALGARPQAQLSAWLNDALAA